MFIVATAIALPCYRWMEGRWPIMPMVGGFFVLVFGGLTIWLQDETFIKLKPTIVNCLFGVILGGGLLLFKRPLLKPIFGAAFQLTDEGWRKLTVRWALFFFVLAAVNEVFWRSFSTDTWIASKMFVSFPRPWSSPSSRSRCSSATGTATTIRSLRTINLTLRSTPQACVSKGGRAHRVCCPSFETALRASSG